MSRRTCLILLLLGLLTGLGGSLAAGAASALAPGCQQGGCHTDPDHDGIHDGPNDAGAPYPDNCYAVKNADQTNTDGDQNGDACDDDDDNDGVADRRPDNCRTTHNPDQADRDGDGVGDECAVDDDGDGLVNERDNCPKVANPDQADSDADRLGDPCDPDDDNDTIADERDNCPKVDNRDQSDRDGDGIGTVCDSGESVGGGTSGGGGTTPAPGQTNTTTGTRPAADSVAPTVSISLPARQRRADLEGGMPTSVRCSEACALTAELRVDATTARRLRLGSTLLGRGTATLAGPGRTWIFVRVRPATRKRIFSGRARKVTARLRLEAVDAAGNRRLANKSLTLSR